MTAKAQRSRAKPKRAGRYDNIELFRIEIESWDWSYSFGIPWDRQDAATSTPYSEDSRLEIKGPMTNLNGGRERIRRVSVILFPRIHLNAEKRPEAQSGSAVGEMFRSVHLECVLSIPADALSALLQMLDADRIHYLDLECEGLVRGKGKVMGYEFASKQAIVARGAS